MDGGRRKLRDPIRGLTLIELMVAMVIGAVLMLGAATLFLQSKVSYMEDEELARLQEGGRYAIRYLTRELSMAGFYGGVLRGSDISVDSGVADPNDADCFSYLFRIEDRFVHINDPNDAAAFDDSGMPVGTDADDCLDTADLRHGADVLVFRRVKDVATTDHGELADGASIDSSVVYLEIEDYNVSIALKTGLSSAASDTDLWEFSPQILFLRNYSLEEDDGIPTLCRRTITRTVTPPVMGGVECLVEGVEDMQVELGIDTDGDLAVDTYDPDPNEPTPDNAITARIYLLVRSPNEVVRYTNNKSFVLGSKTVSAVNDGFYRRVIQSTVSLRNSEALGI